MYDPDVVKDINIQVFFLVSRTNETRYREFHETCKHEVRLDANVCNDKRSGNKAKCRCEWDELVDKGVCVIKGSFGNQVIVIVNEINHKMLENI